MLGDDELRARLRRGCDEARERYTMRGDGHALRRRHRRRARDSAALAAVDGDQAEERMSRRARRAPAQPGRLVVVGPLPPPYHGASVSTGLLVSSETLQQRFALEHVDISDRRDGRSNIGRWDIENVTGGVGGALRLLARLRGPRGVVYLPIAQNVPGDPARLAVHPHRRAAAAGRSPSICAAATSATSIAPSRRAMRAVDALHVAPRHVDGGHGRVAAAGVRRPDARRADRRRAQRDPGDRAPGAADRPQQVLFFSNLRRRKGIIEAVDAALRVLRECPTARFVFVGDWESDGARAAGPRTRATGRRSDRVSARGDGR